jgi:hypothetical protein
MPIILHGSEIGFLFKFLKLWSDAAELVDEVVPPVTGRAEIQVVVVLFNHSA